MAGAENKTVVGPSWDQCPDDWRVREAHDYGQDEADFVKAGEERRVARAAEERQTAILAAARPLSMLVGDRVLQQQPHEPFVPNPVTQAVHNSFNSAQ